MAEPMSLYRDILLDHARNPRRSGYVDNPDLKGSAHNPLCGDHLDITIALADQTIRDIRGAVRGCVIAQASCSLMLELVAGKTTKEALDLGVSLRQALEDNSENLPPQLASLTPLLEVKRHRSRIGCALLAWEALASARSLKEVRPREA